MDFNWGNSLVRLGRKMSEQVKIPLNKQRIKNIALGLGILAILILMLSWWISENQDWVDPLVFQVAGLVIAVILILTGANASKKIKSTTAGLVFDENGITDNSSSISLGLIKWKDIIEIKAEEDRLLLIVVKKPEAYINQASNSAIKRLLSHNLTHYKTPVVIDSKYLEGTFTELFERSKEEIKKYKR